MTGNKYSKIRGLYGLSKAGMSKVLGMGINLWRMYENGDSMPVGSYGRLIDMVRDPRSMLKLLRENERVLRSGRDVGLGNRKYEALVRRCEGILSRYDQICDDNFEKWLDKVYKGEVEIEGGRVE